MTPQELAADMRSKINPLYAATLGTESYERRLCVEAIESLLARIENAPLAVMDTRVALGICALKEEDFPALCALRGQRVRLLID